MTEADIALAKARASDVCDGFLQVRMTQARDVVRLANELMAANRKIVELQRKIDELGKADFGNVFTDLINGRKNK